MRTEDVVILALDGLSNDVACELVEAVGDRVWACKIHDLVDDQGYEVIDHLKYVGASRVWVDYKLHDIPTTVLKRAEALRKWNADIVSVHASGGAAMTRAAVSSGISTYAVTVLSSLSEDDVKHLYCDNLARVSLSMAREAMRAGVQGIVCSPWELLGLRHVALTEFPGVAVDFITPGIRSVGIALDDQSRVATPLEALRNGATRIVVGRQITRAVDPVRAFDLLQSEIDHL